MHYVKLVLDKQREVIMNPNAIKKLVITATEVQEHLALKESIKALNRRIELLTESLDKSEQNLIAKLDFGADPSACGFDLSVRETEKRFPAWKEHFISAQGKAEADRILESTEAKLYRDLIIKKAS